MRRSPSSRLLAAMGLAMACLLAGGPMAGAQESDSARREAFFRAVGEHFGIPIQEVTIISEWDLSPDEVPVVLFVSQRGGVSPDALIGVRRGGRPWTDVANRFGVGASSFHLPFPDNAQLGSLTRAYGEFRGRPARDWAQVRLDDSDIVTLVNLRVLAEATGAPPLQVLRMREEAGSFLAAYFRLIRR